MAGCYIDSSTFRVFLVTATFNQRFDQHAAWRADFTDRLRALREWMMERDLLDAAVEERMRHLETQVRAEKVMVAFVAEFSRGKSELINAIFFAGYGRRIMPASAGRTTMCPTELGWDAAVPPCLRLLPIETRLQPQPLMEWRMVPERWSQLDLDMSDPVQLAQAMEKVAETTLVSVDEARALGLWDDETPEDNPVRRSDGRVEVPRWRHALINLPHPLLKEGLVVLDTPGLNAIGAEPELTVNLIPQAHAVVFVLAADTGVTRSDLAIWREHLVTVPDDAATRFVVLNKVDTLWDGLSTPAQVKAQIERQRADVARVLNVEPPQVVALSAQKGLLAKVRGDAGLLHESQLPELERVLSEQLIGQRQRVLRAAVAAGVAELRAEATRLLHVRRRNVAEQLLELRGLRGKNEAVVRQIRLRIQREQAEFDQSGARMQAVRTVHLKLLRDVFGLLGNSALKKELISLNAALRQPGIKFGSKAVYGTTFERLRAVLRQVQALEDEIETMLKTTFRQLNADYGFSLQVAPPPDMTRFVDDLSAIERSHMRYLSVGNMLRLARPDVSDKLVRALHARVRGVYETALAELELWNKSASAQLDAQLRERRRQFSQRIEAIARIQQAAGGLEARISEIEEQESALTEVDRHLHGLTEPLTAGDVGAAADDEAQHGGSGAFPLRQIA